MKTILLVSSLLLTVSAFAVPNPASVYCAKKGGEGMLVISKEGQSSLCVLGKAKIEEWTLYRYARGESSLAVFNLFNAKVMARSPEQKCLSLRGKVVLDKLANGADVTLCEFRDRSIIEAATLLRGAGDSSNAKLVQVLRNP